MDKMEWYKGSWKNRVINQQPDWPDKEKLHSILSELTNLPALVFSGETRELKTLLSKVNEGSHFILQAGNCAESFSECNGPEIHNYMRIMWAMTDILARNSGKKIIKIGRVAGQYAKPRSKEFELVDGLQMPVYRGDNINSPEATLQSRTPDPSRLLDGYFRSVATLNLIRAFNQGNYNEDNYRSDWYEFPYSHEIKMSKVFRRYADALSNLTFSESERSKSFFISHEALLLDYEEAFTRLDTTFGGYYNTSAHFLWVGDRTRHLDSAHLEYLRGIGNPIGIKVGPEFSPDEIIEIIKMINPTNEKGKVVLILRFGKDNIDRLFPNLINSISKFKLEVIWMIDPMHGNTFSHGNKKTRDFIHIKNEIDSFFTLCKKSQIVAGGIHLEITSKLVTECIGGVFGVETKDLDTNYESKVDPRLNGAQAVELALELGKLF